MDFFRNISQWILKQPKQYIYIGIGVIGALLVTIIVVANGMNNKIAPVGALATSTPMATADASPTLAPTTAPGETPAPTPDQAMQKVNEIKIEAPPSAADIKGTILVDGSAIAGQISQLVADKYREIYKKVQVDVGVSGTTEGMQRFAKGEIDACQSTRQMTTEEAQAVSASGISYAEFKLGYNGIVIVTSASTSWGDQISMTEIRKLWDEKTRARRFNEVNSKWSTSPIKLFCKDSDSVNFNSVVFDGTDNQYSRNTTRCQSDGELLSNIQSEPDSIAFCNYEFYVDNKDKLKAFKLITADGPVSPTDETLKSGKYTPLSKSLYLYINKKAMSKEYIKAYVKVYLENVSKFVKAADFAPLSDEEYKGYLNKIQ